MKQNIFWICMGLVLVGCGVWWYWQIAPAHMDAEEILHGAPMDDKGKSVNNLTRNKSLIHGYATTKGAVRNPHFKKAAGIYKAGLAKRQEIAQERWEARQLQVDWNQDFLSRDGTPYANHGDVSLFIGRLVEQYEVRNKILTDIGCELPPEYVQKKDGGYKTLGDHDPGAQVAEDEHELWLKRLIVSRKVFEALRDANAAVTDSFVQDESGAATKAKPRQIDAILKFTWVDPDADLTPFRFNAQRRAETMFDKWPDPYQVHTFDLKFRAHASLAPRFLQKLNQIDRFLATPTRLYIASINQDGFSQRAGGRLKGLFGGAKKNDEPEPVSRLKNLRGREAPVTVSIRFEVLEFDFKRGLEFDKKKADKAWAEYKKKETKRLKGR